MQNHAQRINIGGKRRLVTLEELRRHVVGCSDQRSRVGAARRRRDAARQAEVGDDGPYGAIRPLGQDDIAALEIAVNHLIAMRFGQSGAKLAGDRARLLVGEPPAAQALDESFSLEKLHRDEIDLPASPRSRVNLENLAHVGVADAAGRPYLRWEATAEARLGAFDSDPAVQLFVLSLIDDTHAALGHLAHDAEAALEQIARREGAILVEGAADRIEQEAIHPLLPLDVFPGLIQKLGIPRAGVAKKRLALIDRPRERQIHQAHHRIVIA